MDDRKAILNLSTYFQNDSEDYLRRMYWKHNCDIEETIKAIYEDKLKTEKSWIRRFLESFWNPFLKYCAGPKINRLSPPGSRNIADPGPSSPSQDEVFFEVNIGEGFVKKLEEKFADPSLTLPEGFQPIIEIPVALGRQLYVAYIESVYRQQEQEDQAQILNQLDREDEEFAKELQLQQRDPETGSAAISHVENYIPNTVTEEEFDDKEFVGQNTETKKSIGSKSYLEEEDLYYLIDEKKEFAGIFQENDKICLEGKQVLAETEALARTKDQVEEIKASAFLGRYRDEQNVQFKEKQEEENQAAIASKQFLKSDNMVSKNMEYQFYEVINEVEFVGNKKYDPSKLIDEDKEFAQKFQEEEETELVKTLKNEEQQDEDIMTSAVSRGYQSEIKDVTSKLFSEPDKLIGKNTESYELINEVTRLEENKKDETSKLFSEPDKLIGKNTESYELINEVTRLEKNKKDVTSKLFSEPDKLIEKNTESYELINEVTRLEKNKKLKNITVTVQENQNNWLTKKKSTVKEETIKKNQDTKEKNGSKQITKKKRRKKKSKAFSKLQQAALKEYQTINQLTNKNKISPKGALKEDQEANNATSSKENHETSNQIIKKKRKKKGKQQKLQEPKDKATNGLKASSPQQSQNVLKDESLLEATNSEVLKTLQQIRPSFSATDFKEEKISSLDKSNTNTNSASHYREEAQRHLEERQKLYQKAQCYLKTKKRDLADYYFQQARKERDLYEQNNRLAAAAFLAENRQQNPVKNTIDLHYLYVKEAIEALDDFLDDEIRSLESKLHESKSLMIITGRGKHSNRGIPRIKPAVIKRLAERQLRYSEMNPGLLKVHISKYSSLTNELENDNPNISFL